MVTLGCVNEVIDILIKNKFLSYSFTLCDVFFLILCIYQYYCASLSLAVSQQSIKVSCKNITCHSYSL